MSVNLFKGQTISLDQQAGGVLGLAGVGIGWYPVISRRFLGIALEAAKVELETACTLLDEGGRVIEEFCARQPGAGTAVVRHDGAHRLDNYEEFCIDLAHMPARVASLLLTVRSVGGADFSLVDTAYVRIADADSGSKVAYFTLPAGGRHNEQVMARLYRDGDGWLMHAIGAAGPKAVPAPASAAALARY